MKCQSVCPGNRSVMTWCDDCAEFTEHETARSVERVPFDQLPGDAQSGCAASNPTKATPSSDETFRRSRDGVTVAGDPNRDLRRRARQLRSGNAGYSSFDFRSIN